MNSINDKDIVKKQYENSNNLNLRISIHDKYSFNKQGFGNWIFENYNILPNANILELGCGTANMWNKKDDIINKCNSIVLSDLSLGMIETAKNNIKSDKIDFRVIDIQNIPYEDNSFDIVIANMMLYHVPDLNKALSEVKRVLKSNGVFYCATYGENGIMNYLSKILGFIDNTNKNFTLQNGNSILKKHFNKVEMLEYKDHLEVSNVNDLIDYIYSLSSMSNLNMMDKDKMYKILNDNMVDGIINIPKEYGMFIAKK